MTTPYALTATEQSRCGMVSGPAYAGSSASAGLWWGFISGRCRVEPRDPEEVIATIRRIASRGGLTPGFARELIEAQERRIRTPRLEFGAAGKEKGDE